MLVKNNKPNVFTAEGVRLGPGVNEVKLGEWLKARKHPIVVQKLAAGVLEELTEVADVTKNGEGEVASVSEDKVRQINADLIKSTKQAGACKALIVDTFHPVVLNAWLERETRKPIQDMIKKQLKLIDTKPEMRDRSKSNYVDTGNGVEVIELTAKPSSIDD